MTNASKAVIGIGWVLAAMALGACGGDSTPGGGDAGPRVDGGGTPGADAGPLPGDAGSEPAGDTATWSVSGARTESRSHDGDTNYVSCAVVTGGGSPFLDMTSAEYAGGDPAITVRVMDYTGPGTYELEFETGSPADATADVRLLSGYSYHYFYNYSTIDFSEIYSMCTITVDETIPGVRIHALVSCSHLVADILSTDYDDRDAAGYRPHASLTATFDCDL